MRDLLDRHLPEEPVDKPQGCPYKQSAEAGMNSEIQDLSETDKSILKALISLGKFDAASFLARIETETLSHSSLKVTAVLAVIIDRFCEEYLESVLDFDLSLKPLDQELIDWWKLIEAEEEDSDARLLLNYFESITELSSHNKEQIKTQKEKLDTPYSAITVCNAGMSSLFDYVAIHEVEDSEDKVLFRATALGAQAHVLDVLLQGPDPDILGYYPLSETTERAEKLADFVKAIRKRVKIFSQKRVINRFFPEYRGTSAGYHNYDVDLVAQKPRIGCPILYSGRLRFLAAYVLKELKDRPKEETKLPDISKVAIDFIESLDLNESPVGHLLSVFQRVVGVKIEQVLQRFRG